jgi:glycosyltransferase involved in cell wall biosynthesis
MVRDAAFVLTAKRAGIPVFLVLHGSLDNCFSRSLGLLEPVRRILLRNVARIGVLSQSEQMMFQRVFPSLRDRVDVIKNIVHRRFLETVPETTPTPQILFISRFLRAKGPFDILHAIPQVIAEIPDAKFVFAGAGPDRSEFQAEIFRLNLSKAVVMLDNVPNEQTPELYRQAWVVVLPSHFPEGMPMVVAEAMACGLPLITTRMRFAESYFRERENVLYVSRGDSSAIAARILELLRKPELRSRMSIANRQLANSLFNAEIVTAEFIDIYARISADFPRRMCSSSSASRAKQNQSVV